MPEGPIARVLFISRNMPPLVGGMERLSWHLADELQRRLRLELVAPRGAAALAPRGVVTAEATLNPLPAFLAQAMLAALRLARKSRPDVVLAGSGLMAPIAEAAARAAGASAACYVHGLDIVVRNRIYQSLWLPSIRRMDRVIANSRYTANLCEKAGVQAERVAIVHPGVALPCKPAPDRRSADAFRERHGLGRGPCLLSVGRLTARKGLREFVASVLPRIAASHPGVRLLVAGGEAANALHSERLSPAELMRVAADAGVGPNLILLGRLDDEALDDAWATAAVHVFPLREIPGDPEGFGMVAVEAAARGVPTVAYAVGGVPDAVLDGTSGVLVPPGDAEGFARAVERAIDDGFEPERMRAWAEGFGWRSFGDAVAAELSVAASRRDGTR